MVVKIFHYFLKVLNEHYLPKNGLLAQGSLHMVV